MGPVAALLVGVLGRRRERRDERRKPEHEGEQKQHAPDLHNLNLAYRFMDTRPIKAKHLANTDNPHKPECHGEKGKPVARRGRKVTVLLPHQE